MPRGRLPLRFGGHVQLVGHSGAGPGHAEKIILYISSGLGMPQDPIGAAVRHCWEEGRLDYLAKPAAPEKWKVDRWMNGCMLKRGNLLCGLRLCCLSFSRLVSWVIYRKTRFTQEMYF